MRVRVTSGSDDSISSESDATRLGVVYEVAPGSMRVLLENPDEGLTSGDYIVVHSNRFGIICAVREVRITKLATEDHSTADAVLATVIPVATLEYATEEITEGALKTPFVGEPVYRADHELIRRLSGAKRRGEDERANVVLAFATLKDAEKSPLTLTPELIFGRHCAVLGTTGGGKSWTLAKLVEETSRYRSKAILFDASGEFSSLTKGAVHVHVGKHPNAPRFSEEVVLPYYQLKETDIFAIFQPTGQAQGPKLRAAMKSLKLALLAPALAIDGHIVKANKIKTHYETEYARHITEIERPEANFDIHHLVQQIQNECVNPYRSVTEPQVWGDVNGLEHSLCVPLINRIQDIVRSPNLEPMFNPRGKPSLLDVIDKFFVHPTAKVLVISLQYLSFAHSAREIIANATARYLLELARAEKFREQPLLVFLDEAHQFLSSTLENVNRDLSLDSFGMIAKEGRKYCLNICIATQRPRDIPESVLSQMGTFIVHRLINDSDLSVVERAAGGADSATMSGIPLLPPGTAVMIGADLTAPLAIKVLPPITPPHSKGPDYQAYWLNG